MLVYQLGNTVTSQGEQAAVPPARHAARGKALFLGSKALGLKVLCAMAELDLDSLSGVATFDDSEDTRTCYPEFRTLTEKLSLPFTTLSKPSALAGLVERTRPTVVVVCGWYWRIPRGLLGKVPGGWVGMHASLLPRYRGFAPLVWALLNGEEEAGVSLFYLEDGLDTGNILAQRTFPLAPDAAIGDALEIAEVKFLEALRESYPLLLSGRAPRRPQPDMPATYGAQRRPEDGRLDWNQPNRAVHNAVRAQSRPYPGAFAFVGERKLIIWRASVFAAEYFGPPGLVVGVQGGEATVTCGSGAIILHEVEFPGEASRHAGEVLKFGMRLS